MSCYLFIGLAFAYFYLMVYFFYPSDFIGLDAYPESRAIYFSFITLLTVGYGDVITTSPFIQTFTWIEAFCGQVYIVVFISRLVARHVHAELFKKTK